MQTANDLNVRAAVRPINLASAQAFAKRAGEAHARMVHQLEVAEAQRVRESTLIREASAAAHHAGVREGFTHGTHWGMFVGAVITVIAGALVLVGIVFAVGGHAPRLW